MKSFKHHITEVYKDSGLGKWFGKGGEGGTTKGGWDRYNSSGEKVGKCGDAEEGDAYAACLSAKKAAKLGKKGIASFVRRKRAAQNKAGRGDKGDGSSGKKPINVKTGITDKDPSKKGIQDSHMKSFKNYIEEENKPTNPELWSQAKSKARAKFDVYPSAYANAWASKWYKSKGGGWKKTESVEEDFKPHMMYDKDGKEYKAKTYQDHVRMSKMGYTHKKPEVKEEVTILENGEKRKVKLNDPFRTPGGPKKFSVYVKNEKGNVVKVNFGDPKMEIKRDDPERRKSFRARHNCDNPGPKWKARYWSCYQWRGGAKVDN